MCTCVWGVGRQGVCDIACIVTCGTILELPLRISPKIEGGRGFYFVIPRIPSQSTSLPLLNSWLPGSFATTIPPTITLQRRRRDCRIIASLVTGLVTHHASLVAVFWAFSQQSRNILGALSKHLRIALGALSEYARSCLELPRSIPGAAREWTSERAGAWVSESVSGVGE